MEEHLQNNHPDLSEQEDSSILVDMAEMHCTPDEDGTYPLCKKYTGPIKKLFRHVAKHQEQLALFSLLLSVRDVYYDRYMSDADEADEAASASEVSHRDFDESYMPTRRIPKSPPHKMNAGSIDIATWLSGTQRDDKGTGSAEAATDEPMVGVLDLVSQIDKSFYR